MLLAVLIIVLFLPPFAILGNGGGEAPTEAVGAGVTAAVLPDMPAPPDGFAAVSPWHELKTNEDVQGKTLVIDIKLLAPTQDARGLAFYSYENGTWRRLAQARLVNNGEAAQAEIVGLPANVVVLRRISTTYQVWGTLPADGEVDPRGSELLTVVNPLGLQSQSDGSIAGDLPAIPSTGAQIYPTLRPVNQEAAAAILSSDQTRSSHAAAIIAMLDQRSLNGVNIDYGVLSASLKDSFTRFVEELATGLHEKGKVLSVTLPMPSRRGDSWDSGAYDWQRLGRAADFIVIVPVRDQSQYRAEVPAALEFVTGSVDPRKLILVISTYSHEMGSAGVRSLRFMEAMDIATAMSIREPQSGDISPGDRVLIVGDNIYRQNGASGILWSDDTATVSFVYRDGQETRTVWLENAYSIAFKLEIAQVYNLGGISLEDISSAALVGIDPWAPIAELVGGASVRLLRPNDTLLRPDWQVSDGELEGGAAGAVAWRSPGEPGSYELTLVLSDGLVRVARRLQLEVSGAAANPTPTQGPALTPVPTQTQPPELETHTPTPQPTQTATPVVTATPTTEATPVPTPTPTQQTTPLPTQTTEPTPQPTVTATPGQQASSPTPSGGQ